MTTAFVLGNGTSRRSIDLYLLKNHGKIYGCNALYREFVPDVLVATDKPIATAIQGTGYAKVNEFYTRRPINDLGAKTVPKPYFGYSSGPIAVALAAIQGNSSIYLLGFDMGPSKNNTINNLYAGTEFYKPENSPPTFSGNWVRQLVHIIKEHKNSQFVRVTGPTTAAIAELEMLPNLSHLDLNTFIDRINNKKDL